jgi:NADPH:quinone reductase
MKAIRVTEKSDTVDAVKLTLATIETPVAKPDTCVIEVRSAGVNPSDVKAILGLMPHAVWPRTPGRDYGGIVVDGPESMIGKEVWGSGGELGIRRDGTHARYLQIPIDAVREKPASVPLLEAGAVGVPFITAYEGLQRAGWPKGGDVVLVFGGNGKVGQAAIQLATRAGARVFAVERTAEEYRGHANCMVQMIDGTTVDVAKYVRDMTGGHGADIVYNTVGSPYFDQANRAMATGAKQILISTIDKDVPFNIFSFYRGQHTYVGIDTLALNSIDGARILDKLAPGFDDGSLRPFPVHQDYVYTLQNAAEAYKAVLNGARERVVIKP